MIPATQALQRPRDAKLLVIDALGVRHTSRSAFVDLLHRGDLVVANDAATLPASLRGWHVRSGCEVEVRLAGRHSLAVRDVEFTAIVFGAGDFHTPTEHRPPPPVLERGDGFALGPLRASVDALLGHPRLVAIQFEGSADAIWAGIAQHGRPIQYAHISAPLALWDVWTVIAGKPVAFEPPSAGFVLDWQTLATMAARGIEFATITHAAGISSTGDPALDARLPFDEPYEISPATALAIRRARSDGRRIVAIGTTVVRALEDAGAPGGLDGCDEPVRPGEGLATQRIDQTSQLRVVDVILSGVHEPGTSHYQLLRAFADDGTLKAAAELMGALAYRTHEFGDSVLIERLASRGALSTRRTFAECPPDQWSASVRA